MASVANVYPRLNEPLHGRTLLVAQVLWVGVAVLAFAVYAFWISGEALRFSRICTPPSPTDQVTCEIIGQMGLGFVTPASIAGYRIGVISLMIVPWLLMGWLIFLRGPRSPALLFISLGLITGWATDLTGHHMGSALYYSVSGSPTLVPFALLCTYIILVVAQMTTVAMVLLLPDGTLKPRWTHWLLLIWSAHILVNTLHHQPFFWFPESGVNELLDETFALVMPPAVIYAVWSKYRFGVRGREKAQLKSLFPSMITFIFVYFAFSVWLLIMIPKSSNGSLLQLQTNLVQVGVQSAIGAWFGVAIGLAVLRYNLLETDLFVSRTLVYTALSAALLALYLGVAFGLGRLLGLGQMPWFPLLASALVLVLFRPLRNFLTVRVSRSLYGTRDVPYKAFVSLSQKLQGDLVPQDYFPSIVQMIGQRFDMPFVRIVVETGALRADTHLGAATGETVRFPIMGQEKPLGSLEVALTPGEVLTQEEHSVLTTIAGQLGVGIRSLELTAELQTVRQRLVVTREEERRRLQRDLHDRLGPTLAAQTLVLSSARQLMASDPAQAEMLLVRLEDNLCETLEDVRRLVYSLTPNDLHQLGLLDALRLKLDALTGDDLALELTFPAPPCTYPAAVESAAYHIITEAVTNVVRHARARCCHVELGAQGDRLELSVTDDGLGLTVVRRGIGLVSMRERAEELGGHFSVSSPQGGKGVRVWASLPLHEVQAVLEAAR